MSDLSLSKAPVATLHATATLGAWVAALKSVSAGIGSRAPLPILSGVRITTSVGGYVEVATFDYENAAVATVAGGIGGVGSNGLAVVGYKQLLDILVGAGKRATKRISDGWNVSMALDGNKLAVDVNGAAFTLFAFDAENYPQLPSLTSQDVVTVDAGLFIRRMDSAMVAVSTDDTLPILTSIRIEVENGTMTLLSTDRYRLVMAELPVGATVGSYSALLKAKTWKAWKKALNAKGGTLHMMFHDAEPKNEGSYGRIGATHARLSVLQAGVELGALSVDGDYPKIKSLFPDSTPIVFEMDADQLAACVASVAVVAARNTPVKFTYNGIDSLRVSAGDGEDAQAEAFLPYSSSIGNRGFAVAFNPSYLVDTLKDFKGQRIQFQHTAAPKPATVVGVDSSSVQHLIMPVRLP